MLSIVTSILFSAVVSAPTWKLNTSDLADVLNAVAPDEPTVSLTLTSSPTFKLSRLPV
jgi:hypothetical protein